MTLELLDSRFVRAGPICAIKPVEDVAAQEVDSREEVVLIARDRSI